MNERMWQALMEMLLAEDRLIEHLYLSELNKEIMIVSDDNNRQGYWIFDKRLNVITLEEKNV